MQEKSLNLLKKKLIDLEFRCDWIPEFMNYIEQCINKDAILILLFSSRAKRDFHKDSDIDLLIVSKTLSDDVRKKADDFFSDSLPVQPFVMTPAQLFERIDKLDFLVFDAFEDGLILYSDMDMENINKRLKASKERFSLKRVKSGWNFDAVAAEAAGI
ncbi:MAG: nucleotidyltransferase domain-containing protein [Candidatus Methanoperedens sp.]|nr:nucleotidyltransferase domain-containing protein [Candidatus Methanoperedens sp.]